VNWIWFAILTVLCWGSAPIFEKVGIAKMSPLVAVTVRSVIISLILVMAVLFSGEASAISKIDSRSLVYIAIGGILAGLLGQTFYFYALKSGESSRVVPIAGTYPLVAAILGITLLGETLTLHKTIGVILIVGGILLVK